MADENAQIKRIGSNIRKARQNKQLIQSEAAQKAGISETYYAQVERGEKNPSITVFLRIIEALGTSSKEILGR